MSIQQIKFPGTAPTNGQFLQVTDVSTDSAGNSVAKTEWKDVTVAVMSESLVVDVNEEDVATIELESIFQNPGEYSGGITSLTIDEFGRVTSITASTTPPGPGPDPYISTNLMVAGYIDCTSVAASNSVVMSTAAKDGYSGAIIYGFGWVGPSYYYNKDAAYTDAYIPGNSDPSTFLGQIKKQITEAKKPQYDDQTKCFPHHFLSFGGAAQSFIAAGNDAASNNWSYNGSVSGSFNLQTLAQNMATVAHDVGCNGIDFDFEFPNPSDPNNPLINPNYAPYTYKASNNTTYTGAEAAKWFVRDLADAIKTYANTQSGWGNFYVTCAPQVNRSTATGPYYFVSQGHDRIFDKALADGKFDYVFIQFYNTPPEIDPGYPITAWANLVSTLASGDINTKFIVGYPATVGAAVGWPESITYFNGFDWVDTPVPQDPSQSNPMPNQFNFQNPFWYDPSNSQMPGNILWTPLSTDALLSATGLNTVNNTLTTLSNTSNYPNFGGVFCWSMNRDYYNFKNVYGEPQNVNWEEGKWGKKMKAILD